MKVSKSITLIIRLVQLIFAAVIMSLVGHMIATSGWNMIPREGGNAALVNYAIFITVFTLLSMVLFVPAGLNKLSRVELFYVLVGLDGLNTLFYLCGGLALAAALGVHSCENSKYTETNGITNSSPDTAWRCREAQAATAFVWFNFAVFVGSTFLSANALWRKVRNEGGDDNESHLSHHNQEYVGGPAMTDNVGGTTGGRVFSVPANGGPHLDGGDLRSDRESTRWRAGIRDPHGDHEQTNDYAPS